MVDFDEILVPVDGSESAHRAVQFAARLAAALGKPLRLTHVVALTPEAVMALAKMSKAEIQAAQQSQARGVLDQAKAAVASTGEKVALDEVVMVGDAAQEILSYVEAHPKTLVVMGRRGVSTIRGLLLGSVSEKVTRHAPGAVTLVH